MAHISDAIVIEAPVDEVHSIADDPRRWSSWYVGLGDASRIEGDGGPGTTVVHPYLLAGVSFPVTTHVLENEHRPDGSYHWRSEFEGPLHGWQVWDYLPVEQGTEVRVDIDYTVPGKALGKIADRLVIEKMQERAGHETLERLKLLVEGAH